MFYMFNPKLIDIHAHVNFNAFKDDSDEVMQKTLKEGVGGVLVGSQIDTSRRAVEFANKYGEGVWAAVGLHPVHLVEGYRDHKEIDLPRTGSRGGAPGGEALKGFKSRKEEFNHDAYYKIGIDKKTVAIGECGLDYFRLESDEELKLLQQEAFRDQVRLG